jgi:coenzyme F420-dependent glucose-6-phosphate dehydrogenase
MNIRFGYKASSEQFGPNELLDYAVGAEENGFDSVFLSDHLQPWMHEGGHAPAAVPWLGAAGQATSRITLGTSVLTPTFRYHPGVIAQEFATLGAMNPGRVILGVGTGEALNEVTLGQEWPDPPERFQRMKEAILLIRELWRGERVTYDGTFYRVSNATIYDRPEQEVPIYIGASGPAATRLAGRIADGWITTSGKDPSLYTETLIPAFEDGLAKGGQANVDRMLEVKVSFRPDRARALENTRFWAPLALSPEEKTGVTTPSRCSASRRSCRSSGPRAASSSRTIPTSTSRRSSATSTSDSRTSSSTTRAMTRPTSSTSMAAMSCQSSAPR